jgi:hypothetical protein
MVALVLENLATNGCNQKCQRSPFIQDYTYHTYLPEIKQQVTEIALNGSGI